MLRELVDVKPELRMRVIGRGEEPGFMLVACYDDVERLLMASRNTPRTFATLDAAANCVRALGMTVFEVDISEFQRGRIRGPRLDRAEALRLANQQSTAAASKKRKR